MTIQQLLLYSVEHRSSDLHLVAGSPPTVRIDGDLVPVAGEPILSTENIEKLIFSALTEEQIGALKANKELDSSFALGTQARFRVNVYSQRLSWAASFRHIPKIIPGMMELGLPKVCKDLVNVKQGLVLVTGPTGHGKSTSLASMIEEINQKRPVHIVTIEDPIEYEYESKRAVVSQREMHGDTHSWQIALRSVLREDPDVVLLGEMRDFETIAAAMTVAETGHLVFATLHTNSASQTLDRIVDVFPENQQPQIRSQLASTLEAVISQRLIPRIGGGRVLAYEVLLSSPAVRTAIRDGKTHQLDNIIITSGEYGMTTLEQSLATLVRSKQITKEMAESYAMRPSDLARNLL